MRDKKMICLDCYFAHENQKTVRAKNSNSYHYQSFLSMPLYCMASAKW